MKRIKKLIIMGIVALSIALPMHANAATLKLDNANRTNDKGAIVVEI